MKEDAYDIIADDLEENIEVLKYKLSRIPMEACLAYKFLIII